MEGGDFIFSCSVVVCTRDRPTQLDRCLEAVARLDYPRFDVLVVDNAPQDGRTREVAARWGSRYIVEPVPGVNRARNRGARTCDTDIVAYLDDDSICEPTWLSGLVPEFRDPQVMAITGRILPLKVTTEAERLFASRGGFDLGQEQRSVDRHTLHWFEMANFGGLGSEANMAFRHSAFEVWPGFNDRIGYGTPLPGCSGPYAFFLLIERGYRVVYTPRAVVYHPYPQTLEDLHARHLKSFAAIAGYMTLLFFEHPRYCGDLMKYLAGWFRGYPRSWRGQGVAFPPRIVPKWRELLACLPGPITSITSITSSDGILKTLDISQRKFQNETQQFFWKMQLIDQIDLAEFIDFPNMEQRNLMWDRIIQITQSRTLGAFRMLKSQFDRYSVLLVLAFFAIVPECAAEGQHTPENPSMILFLAGSAAMGYQYLKARLRR